MNKILVILTALLLSGCAAKVSQLQTPEKIEYNGKTYKLTASQDLDTIARYVYPVSYTHLTLPTTSRV